MLMMGGWTDDRSSQYSSKSFCLDSTLVTQISQTAALCKKGAKLVEPPRFSGSESIINNSSQTF